MEKNTTNIILDNINVDKLTGLIIYGIIDKRKSITHIMNVDNKLQLTISNINKVKDSIILYLSNFDIFSSVDISYSYIIQNQYKLYIALKMFPKLKFDFNIVNKFPNILNYINDEITIFTPEENINPNKLSFFNNLALTNHDVTKDEINKKIIDYIGLTSEFINILKNEKLLYAYNLLQAFSYYNSQYPYYKKTDIKNFIRISKFKKLFSMTEADLYKYDMVDLIDKLKFIKDENLTISFNGFKFIYDLNKKSYKFTFHDIVLFNDSTLNKYKYEFHPGLALINYLLQSSKYYYELFGKIDLARLTKI